MNTCEYFENLEAMEDNDHYHFTKANIFDIFQSEMEMEQKQRVQKSKKINQHQKLSVLGIRPEMSYLQRIDNERKEEKQKVANQEQVKEPEVKTVEIEIEKQGSDKKEP